MWVSPLHHGNKEPQDEPDTQEAVRGPELRDGPTVPGFWRTAGRSVTGRELGAPHDGAEDLEDKVDHVLCLPSAL